MHDHKCDLKVVNFIILKNEAGFTLYAICLGERPW